MRALYAIKEAFPTIQGEGYNAGTPAVFVRFAGCNLWNGREDDRGSAICSFCDTEFVGTDGVNGGKYTADELADLCRSLSPACMVVVLTGGEPLLQVDRALVDAIRSRSFWVAVETNGTVPLPCPIDWVCVSPKAGATLALDHANELKIVWPQEGMDPGDFAYFVAPHRYLQPKDGPNLRESIDACVAHCMEHPQWRLSVQTHKAIGIP